eukprot:CAMPEP_0201716604 /NCGR_PEP_ID=MMETSP0593-20130828/2539_1 /ASSEMBLY_ACC=CAM_ASM_000672 /TAXON_ID=267983 /ORGANISM="Skeletonema japonicum, Strain CCMP2506" /LENGTH=826 /DNA_ID=CAMNT_0048206441 /DNA_START=249 /DNA_END=2729 /DNA_ORIENTATION=+
MSPRNDTSSCSRPVFRRPSYNDPTKPSFDEKTIVTASRTPSPTAVCMTEEAPPQRKKGVFSNLRKSVVGKRRKSSKSRSSGSLHLSSSSIGSSNNGTEQSVSSAHQNLNLSNHSAAAEAILRASYYSSDSDGDVMANSIIKTRKSAISDNSVASSSNSSRAGLGRFSSFSRIQEPQYSNHSSHHTGYTEGMLNSPSKAVDENNALPCNSYHNPSLSDQLYNSPARPQRRASKEEIIDEDSEWGEDGDSHSRRRASSFASSASDDAYNELDERYESEALLERLGDKPSEEELSNITTTRVNEVIREQSMEDRMRFSNVSTFSKTDLIIGRHLGKGSFSDVFEVTVTVEESQNQMGGGLSLELDDRIRAKFGDSGGSGSNPRSKRASFEYKPVNKTALPPVDSSEDEEDDLDKLIDSKFGGGGASSDNEDEGEDLDKLIESKFGGDPSSDNEGDVTNKVIVDYRSASAPPPSSFQGEDLDKLIEAKFGGTRKSTIAPMPIDENDEEGAVVMPVFKPARVARPSRRQRRVTTDLSSSVCVGSMAMTKKTARSRRLNLAMKCLHPISRSDGHKFMIGVEDLIHETVLLSSLQHPNIIKIHGRAELGEGYFILLDKLKDTLDDRIALWRKKFPQSSRNPPSLQQVKVAKTLAETVAFLHDHKIVFHDLKPPNVGFDERGELKLFDFGFANQITDDEPLEDRAGTVRYMAPEVGLDKGHGLPADVYSFTILLWEIFSLKKPFAKIKRTDEFKRVVFESGERPKLGRNWSLEMKEEFECGWSSDPNERPRMDEFVKLLGTWQLQAPARPQVERGQSLRQSLVRTVSKRISWDT